MQRTVQKMTKLQENAKQSDINNNFTKPFLYDFDLEKSFKRSELASTPDLDEESLVKFSEEREGTLKQRKLSALIQ